MRLILKINENMKIIGDEHLMKGNKAMSISNKILSFIKQIFNTKAYW